MSLCDFNFLEGGGFIMRKNIMFFLCFLLICGCATQQGIRAGDNEPLFGQWKVVGERNNIKYLSLHEDKIEFQKTLFSPLRIFNVIINKISDRLFIMRYMLGNTRILVVNDNLLFAYGMAFRRAGTREEEVEYSKFTGKWKSEDGEFCMEIHQGEISFYDEKNFNEIFGVFKVSGDYVFLTSTEFEEYTFILRVSGETLEMFGEFSGVLKKG